MDAVYYHSLVGLLIWMFELRRIDICMEESMMSSHLALHIEDNIEHVFHIFEYLEKLQNTKMLFDTNYPVINEVGYEKQDWSSSEFFHTKGELLSGNM